MGNAEKDMSVSTDMEDHCEEEELDHTHFPLAEVTKSIGRQMKANLHRHRAATNIQKVYRGGQVRRRSMAAKVTMLETTRDEWASFIDESSGHKYYYSYKTGESSWTKGGD